MRSDDLDRIDSGDGSQLAISTVSTAISGMEERGGTVHSCFFLVALYMKGADDDVDAMASALSFAFAFAAALAAAAAAAADADVDGILSSLIMLLAHFSAACAATCLLSKYAAISLAFLLNATIMAVLPPSSRANRFAPAATSITQMSRRFCSAAMCSAV